MIIPAYNEESVISQCLYSIYKQEDHSVEFEVIVINDASTDSTASKVEHFCKTHKLQNLKLHRNDKNEGRFKSRIKGILKANHALILLVDCKTTLNPHAFRSIEEISYSPLVATNEVIRVHNIIDKAFFLIRKKVYRNNYPKIKNGLVYLTPHNFDYYPKGTTVFLCEKSLLLSAIPKRIDKNSSDDTAWLKSIASSKSIMVNNNFQFTYTPRSKLTEITKHLFLRGPKFADYYYNPGKRFYKLINATIIFVLFSILSLVAYPSLLYAYAFTGAIVTAALSCYLSKSKKDFATLLIALPTIATIFGLGLTYGIIIKGKSKK